MLKSSGAMGAATLASRLLGMLREILYARFMGDGPVAAAFKLAFMIPNLFRRLLGEGALTAAFIPIFKEKERTAGEEEMWRSANAVLSALVIAASGVIAIVLIGISALLAFDTPEVIGGVVGAGDQISALVNLAPKVSASRWFSAETRLMLELLRVMFPYMLMVCMAATFMGMLNARGHFFVPALGATVLNGTLIVAVLLIAPRYGETLEDQIFALAFAVLVAGLAQALYQLPMLRREGFRFRWIPPFRNETVRLVGRKMIPGMMGVAAFQLNVVLTQGIAWMVNPQIVASFDYAVRLMEFPQGIIGISLATFLLPTLSGLAAEKRYPEFRETLREAAGYLVFANLIASVLLIVLAEPIVRLLFEGGQFTPFATRRAAFALACLAPGLIAFSAVNILARAFYALGDTRTPMIISSFCLGVNVVLVLWLVGFLAQGGLGLANTVSSVLNVSLLLFALRKKLKFLGLSGIGKELWPMLAAGALAGAGAWGASMTWESWVGHKTVLRRIGAVFGPALFAGVLYGAFSLWRGVPQARVFVDMLQDRFRKSVPPDSPGDGD
jgi:putative peptidoglycan lipid II flippase